MNTEIAHGRRVLWVEDQTDEYDPLEAELQQLVRAGNLVVVKTEEDSRMALMAQRFDLLLLDLMLPENKDGLSAGVISLTAGHRLLRQLRASTDWATPADCRVVLFTARGDCVELEKTEKLVRPLGQVVRKPTPMKAILDIVKAQLAALT